MPDVIVIGAGFSGLEAARRLAGDHEVVVLEARERAGGRTLTHSFANGDETDLGGQWVGPGQDRLYALIAAMGFGTYPLWDDGDHLVAGGRPETLSRHHSQSFHPCLARSQPRPFAL